MRYYTPEQLSEIFERLIRRGFGDAEATALIADLTLYQLEQLSLGIVN